MYRTPNRRYSLFFRLNIEALFLAVILAVLLRLFFIFPISITSEKCLMSQIVSIYCPFKALCCRTFPGFSSFKAGDFIISDKQQIFMIAGLPGQRISIKNQMLHTDGTNLLAKFHDKIYFIFSGGIILKNDEQGSFCTVPDNTYMAVKNIPEKTGRTFLAELISEKNISGRLFFIYWPLKNAGIIK